MSEQTEKEPIISDFADDQDMMELVEMFVDEIPERMDHLQQYYQTQDFDELQRLAHQLKGAGGGYGFSPLSEAAAKLEMAVRQDSPLEIVGETLDELIDLCRRVTANPNTGA